MPWADNYLQSPLSRCSALFSCSYSSMDIMEFPRVAPTSPAIEAKKRKRLSCISHQQHILRDVSRDLQESTTLFWGWWHGSSETIKEMNKLRGNSCAHDSQAGMNNPVQTLLLSHQAERPGLLEFNDPVPPSAIPMWGQLMIWIDGTTQSIKTPGYMTGFQMQSVCLSLNIFTSLISSSFLTAFSTAACFQNF